MALYITEVKEQLYQLQKKLRAHGFAEGYVIRLNTMLKKLDEPMIVMVTGEFSAGKSTFINALLGKKIAATYHDPTTAVLTKFCYGREDSIQVHFSDGTVKQYSADKFEKLTAETKSDFEALHKKIDYVQRELPVTILKNLTLIDSPGLNVTKKEHEAITQNFLHNADLVIWVTDINQAMGVKEKAIIDSIDSRLKPIVIANKIDDIDEEEEEDIDDIVRGIQDELGSSIETVIPISAKYAQDGRTEETNPERQKKLILASNIQRCEEILQNEIDEHSEQYKFKSLIDPLAYLIYELCGNMQEIVQSNFPEWNQESYDKHVQESAVVADIKRELVLIGQLLLNNIQHEQSEISSVIFFRGVLYKYGLAVHKDEIKSLTLFEKAYQDGCKSAGDVFYKECLDQNENKKFFDMAYHLAQNGSINDTIILGMAYYSGIGIEQNFEAARIILEKVLEAVKNPIVPILLSRIYSMGLNVPVNYKKAISLIKPYIGEYPDALVALGDIYYQKGMREKETDKQWIYQIKQKLGLLFYFKRARKCYDKAANLGNVFGMLHLAKCYESGIGVEANQKLAIHWYLQASKLKNTVADRKLADVLMAGDDVQKNSAIQLYHSAAFNGDDIAMTKLGMILQSDFVKGNQNVKAFSLYQKAATMGNPIAQYRLGLCYEDGIGTLKDEQKAFKWYQKAAEQNNLNAMEACANCYINRIGTVKNLGKALTYLRVAASHGLSDAQEWLAYIYLKGEIVEKNDQVAYEWCHNAAESGKASSQWLLGKFYEKGIGVKKNINEANYWYRQAAHQGYPKAEEVCKNVQEDGNIYAVAFWVFSVIVFISGIWALTRN